MKWNETVASKARYGDIAGKIFGDAEIIWENSEADYQGTCSILAYFEKTGKFAHYGWSYGSCPGCDAWENAGTADAEIEREMRETTAWLKNLATALRYCEQRQEMAAALRKWAKR